MQLNEKQLQNLYLEMLEQIKNLRFPQALEIVYILIDNNFKHPLLSVFHCYLLSETDNYADAVKLADSALKSSSSYFLKKNICRNLNLAKTYMNLAKENGNLLDIYESLVFEHKFTEAYSVSKRIVENATIYKVFAYCKMNSGKCYVDSEIESLSFLSEKKIAYYLIKNGYLTEDLISKYLKTTFVNNDVISNMILRDLYLKDMLKPEIMKQNLPHRKSFGNNIEECFFKFFDFGAR
ncbi:hypothetical protein EDEG_03087 [Edhazardia aedis USNM 41457]|uniref:Uncharacterized protein n=1 Tax=Edhazardia aedis (strain USNM 41457) TaxID=1003232 RepID=J9D3V7_EDHAE|nr:hypothetical protein EDEG_03087 [Edhazardia aedis USNM 41457]|eukprot:EJW02501.1 hypothetical protein EDEG_03087 [Edhazardia aedis USNM 41457]